MRGPDFPEVAMPALLGLRTTALRRSLLALVAAYLLVRASAVRAPHTLAEWALELGAVAGFAVALCTVTGGVADPLPRGRTALIAIMSPTAMSAAWWAVPDIVDGWVQTGAPMVVFAVIVGMLALRGRAPWAWSAVAAAVAIAGLWSIDHGGTFAEGAQIVLRVTVALLPATLIALMVRPMVRLTGALTARRAEAMRRAAAAAATLAEREERLKRFESGVRPYLEGIADGADLGEHEARRAQLLENDLRDEVRGRRWHSGATRDAIERARVRGVSVRVLDDAADESGLTDADLQVLQRALVCVLDGAVTGALTARILPAGRDHVAVINLLDVDRVERTVFRRSGGGLVGVTDETLSPPL